MRKNWLQAGVITNVTAVFFLLLSAFTGAGDRIYNCNQGVVSFVSAAPLETIRATSKELKGAVDVTNRTFLFTLHVNTFHGFNSGLQREHFSENYLETSQYPQVTFKGKFVEAYDFAANGSYDIRAKGMLEIHGVQQERIIKGKVTIRGDVLTIDSKFPVLLEDHNIRIPRVVYQKISPEIQVTLHAEMNLMSAR